MQFTVTETHIGRFELGANILMHVFLVFLALTGLFIFIISKASTDVLTSEMTKALETNTTNMLVHTDAQSNGKLKLLIKTLEQPLKALEARVNVKDEATDIYNKSLFTDCFLIIGILGTALVVMFFTMAYGANIRIRPMVYRILLTNVLVFALVGVVEYMFFSMVAMKFVPIKPSEITQNIIESLQKSVGQPE